MSNEKQESKKRHQQFLLSFFPKDSGYSAIKINGFVVVKHWDGNRKMWMGYLYTETSFANQNKYKGYLNGSSPSLSQRKDSLNKTDGEARPIGHLWRS